MFRSFAFFVCLCAGASGLTAASVSPLDRLLNVQTWSTLQGDLKVLVLGDPDRALRSKLYRRSNGDFAVHSTGNDRHLVRAGRFSAKVPGQADLSDAEVGEGHVFMAMHRLLFAGPDAAAGLELLASEGDRLTLRWNDWMRSVPLDVEVDANGRIVAISALDGRAKIDEVAYQSSVGKVHPSAWRQTRAGAMGSLNGEAAQGLWFLYTLEAPVLDAPLDDDHFELP